MKIRLGKTYTTHEVYGTIDFNPQDYPQLEGLSDEDIIEYLNENMYEFTLNENNEVLRDQFIFEMDLLRDKIFDDVEEIILVEE